MIDPMQGGAGVASSMVQTIQQTTMTTTTTTQQSSEEQNSTVTTTTESVIEEQHQQKSGSGLRRSSSWRKFKDTVRDTVTGMVQKTVHVKSGSVGGSGDTVNLMSSLDNEEVEDLAPEVPPPQPPGTGRKHTKSRPSLGLVINSSIPIEIKTSPSTCPIADLDQFADAAFAAAAKMTPPAAATVASSPASFEPQSPVPQIIVTDHFASDTPSPRLSPCRQQGPAHLPQKAVAMPIRMQAAARTQQQQQTGLATSVPSSAGLVTEGIDGKSSRSNPDLSTSAEKSAMPSSPGDTPEAIQARKLAAVMKIKNAILASKTAESLQPPPDSGHVRRSSDVGLESRTGAQRRRSMAPGLEGGSGGSATSLHRSSSMKQQRSGSFNTGKQKPMIWDHFEAVSGQQAGRCKACHMTIQCKYNTGQFVRHLQLAHMDIFRKHQSKVQSEWTKSIVEKNISKNTG